MLSSVEGKGLGVGSGGGRARSLQEYDPRTSGGYAQLRPCASRRGARP